MTDSFTRLEEPLEGLVVVDANVLVKAGAWFIAERARTSDVVWPDPVQGPDNVVSASVLGICLDRRDWTLVLSEVLLGLTRRVLVGQIGSEFRGTRALPESDVAAYIDELRWFADQDAATIRSSRGTRTFGRSGDTEDDKNVFSLAIATHAQFVVSWDGKVHTPKTQLVPPADRELRCDTPRGFVKHVDENRKLLS